ncbi:hypothetical protein KDK77_05770 [bacterium]|nr:hypothetical protein [bacterium]
MQAKESIGYTLILLVLILVSNTSITIGMKKFDQISCAARLTHMYNVLFQALEDDPALFAKNPDIPWYATLNSLKPSFLLCPAAKKGSPPLQPTERCVHYSFNQRYYNLLKSGMAIPENEGEGILFLDSEIDPIGFQIYPFTNPAFRHNGGCMVLQCNGTVRWIDKDSFGGQSLY